MTMTATAPIDLADLIALDLSIPNFVPPSFDLIDCAFCGGEISSDEALRDEQELAWLPVRHARGWCDQTCYEAAQESMYA